MPPMSRASETAVWVSDGMGAAPRQRGFSMSGGCHRGGDRRPWTGAHGSAAGGLIILELEHSGGGDEQAHKPGCRPRSRACRPARLHRLGILIPPTTILDSTESHFRFHAPPFWIPRNLVLKHALARAIPRNPILRFPVSPFWFSATARGAGNTPAANFIRAGSAPTAPSL